VWGLVWLRFRARLAWVVLPNLLADVMAIDRRTRPAHVDVVAFLLGRILGSLARLLGA
jgi:hypothetical protein